MQILIRTLLYLILLSSIILVIFSIRVVLIDVFNKFNRAGKKDHPDPIDFLVDLAMVLTGLGGAMLALWGLGYL